MVIALLPTSSGTVADHLVVPEAVPEYPVELVHFTAATPTLSLAVPLIAMEAEEVDTIVNPGATILSDGGVVSPLVGGVAAGGCTGGVAAGGAAGGSAGVVGGGAAGDALTAPYSA